MREEDWGVTCIEQDWGLDPELSDETLVISNSFDEGIYY